MHCVLHAAEKALTTVCRKHPALFVCLATQGASVAWSCFLFFSLYFVKMPDWTHLHVCQEALLRAVVVLIVCVGVCSVRSLAPVFSRTHTAKYNIVLQNKNLARLFTASVCAFSAHRLLWHDFCFFFFTIDRTQIGAWDLRLHRDSIHTQNAWHKQQRQHRCLLCRCFIIMTQRCTSEFETAQPAEWESLWEMW